MMTIAKVVLAFGRRALAAIKGASLPTAMGPAQPFRDRGLVAAFDRAFGATTVGPTESARLDATIAPRHSASDRAALKRTQKSWFLLGQQQHKNETNE
jgi:hypothetical protein